MDVPSDPNKAVYYRKQVPLFRLVEKMKLWPSRRGLLHGIKEFEVLGSRARLTTHCGKTMIVRDSKNSRSARWLRNKLFFEACPAVPHPGVEAAEVRRHQVQARLRLVPARRRASRLTEAALRDAERRGRPTRLCVITGVAADPSGCAQSVPALVAGFETLPRFAPSATSVASMNPALASV